MKFNGYTEEQSEILNDVALDVYGLGFDWLDEDDQDYIECLAMDEGLI